jgi:hypothetical protein
MKNLECRKKKARGRAGLRRAIRHWSFVILPGLLCLLLPAKSFSQSSNRWLLVFNTSSAMHDRVDGVEGVMQDLLTTAMHGNLRSGDTIGIWTYDRELRANEAPLLTWDPESAPAIAQHMTGFLGRHHYEKTAAFGSVLTNMLRVIKDSDVVTVILISDGSDTIHGTPFDAKLNAFYKENYRAQKKAHLPVVTVFRGEHGNLAANTMNLAPWPADIPAVPPPEIAKVVTPKVIETPKPPPPVVTPPLIIVGKKVETPAQYAAVVAAESNAAEPKTETPPAAPAPVAAPKVTPEEKTNPTTTTTEDSASPVAPAAEMPKAPIATERANAATNEEASMTSTAPPAQPGVETAASVPPRSLFSARNLGIVSAAFAVIVCGFLILAARRARRQSQESLITRSLDREK